MKSAKLCLLILTTLILTALPAAAGAGVWTPLGPEGAHVTVLAVDPSDPDVVYAGTQMAGIYKTTDAGATWSFAGRGIGTDTVVAFAVALGNSGTAYAAGLSGAIFKTTDGGGSWVRVWTGVPPSGGSSAPTFALALDPRRPHIVFAGTGHGLYRSADGGATWSLRGLSGVIGSLAYDSAGGWLYAGVNGEGVFRSFDQGNTWEPVSSGLPTLASFLSLAIDPNRPRTLLVTTPFGLYRSTDRGEHWQPVRGAPANVAGSFAIAVAFAGRGQAYALFISGVFRSADSGATWTRSANLPGRFGGQLRAVAASPSMVYVGAQNDPDGPGLYRSQDFGATFQPAVRGLHGLEVNAVAVDPADGRTIYAAVGRVSVYKTTNGGATWTRLRLGPLSDGFYPVIDILIDPDRPSTLWTVGGVLGIFGPGLRSDDGGATWSPLGSTDQALLDLALDPRAPDALWSVGGDSVYHSADGGATWERRALGAGGFVLLEQVQVDPDDPDVIYVAGTARVDVRPPHFAPAVFRSADGGQTWERRDGGLSGDSVADLALDAADTATLYAATGRLFRSFDAGAAWTPAPGLPGFAYVTVATAPGAVYTARQLPTPAVLRSTDRGETWRSLRRGLGSALPVVLEVDPTNPAHLLLGTRNRGLMSYTVGGAP